MPFYCWQCITLNLRTKDIDLVLAYQAQVKLFLEFLIYELNTVDGIRGTGLPIYQQKYEYLTRGSLNKTSANSITEESKELMIKTIRQTISSQIMIRYNILSVRMKISYMAF